MKRWLWVLSGVLAAASLVAWAFAYSPMDCYAALPRTSSWPVQICDPRFGMTFIFTKDSPANILAVLGLPAAWAAVVLALTWHLLGLALVFVATLVAMGGWLVWWLGLMWFVDRTPYHCAFGFGGFGCSGLLDHISLLAVFLGWLAPVAALVVTPLIGFVRGRKASR